MGFIQPEQGTNSLTHTCIHVYFNSFHVITHTRILEQFSISSFPQDYIQGSDLFHIVMFLFPYLVHSQPLTVSICLVC